MIYNSLLTNEPLWFFYYLTHWGLLLSAFSVYASIKAADNSRWQTTAMLYTQIATGLNLNITLLFWVVLAPYIFPNLGWTGNDLYMRVHMITLHVFPWL